MRLYRGERRNMLHGRPTRRRQWPIRIKPKTRRRDDDIIFARRRH